MSLLPKKSFRQVTPEFHEQTRHARKVLVTELGTLGDLVQALPALWAIRQSYPQAQLHCVVRGHVAGLLRVAPWIDRVWPYYRHTRGIYRHDLKMARLIRAEHYDVAINLSSSNRSCIIGFISGAPFRLGRRPNIDDRDGWRWLSTHVMQRQAGVPVYIQQWQCVAQAGLVTPQPTFQIVAAFAERQKLGFSCEDEGRYLHFSPCTSVPQKELPLMQTLQLLTQLHRQLPQFPIVLSCSPNPRERETLALLLQQLPFRPWKVFDGTLNELELLSVVQGAALQLCGDTGPLHLAWLTGRPSVSWVWSGGNIAEWCMRGSQHRYIFSDERPHDYLRGIDSEAVISAARQLLDRQELALAVERHCKEA